MTITAMLAWYDEPVELLREAVTSSATIADRLIAADGAYELVADAKSESPRAQKAAIVDAASRAGLEVNFITPRLWKGQVEKRNAILREAQQGSDWVFPLDADWVIRGNRDAIRTELELSKAEQISVKLFQPINQERSTVEIAPHPWHVQMAGQTTREPLLMRVLADMRVEKLHWVYSGVRADGKRVGFWGGAHYYMPARGANLQAPCLFEHRCLFREDKQLQRNRVFSEQRDRKREAVGYED